MYSFSHNIDNRQRYNTYQYYHEEIPKERSFSHLLKPFLLLILIGSILIAVIFAYSSYTQQPIYVHHQTKVSGLQPIVAQAITKSIAKNIQSKQLKQPLNDEQLKRIIKRVVKKINVKSTKTIYTES